ncbi:MAG: InlB B-repeat-containing protein [Oscillospiraceae bacterium]|nr:InlB B-repeat-containing protein [Oscillospiraceae bacterium]
MRRRALSLFMALIMIFGMLPTNVWAASAEQDEIIVHEESSDYEQALPIEEEPVEEFFEEPVEEFFEEEPAEEIPKEEPVEEIPEEEPVEEIPEEEPVEEIPEEEPAEEIPGEEPVEEIPGEEPVEEIPEEEPAEEIPEEEPVAEEPEEEPIQTRGVPMRGFGDCATVEYTEGGTETFSTLEAAIEAAGTVIDGHPLSNTVTLVKDIELTEMLTIDKTVTLDLNGKTISSSGRPISVTGSLTVKDSVGSGLIKSTGDCGIEVVGGTLTFESGAVQAQEMAIIFFDGATGSIKGGTFTAIDNAVLGTNGNAGRGGNTINITGGTFNGGITSAGYVACGIYAANNDTWNISGGTFNITGGAGIVARAGNVNVTGGVFNTTGSVTGKVGDSRVVVPCAAIVFDSEAAYPGMTNNSVIAVSGGSFTSEVTPVAAVGESHIAVSGGTYSSPVPVECCAEGFEPSGNGVAIQTFTVTFNVEGIDDQTVNYGAKVTKPEDPEMEGKLFAGWYNGDTLYDFTAPVTSALALTAKWDDAVAKIGDVGYDTLAAAVAAAEADDTIKLVADTASSSQLVINKSLTIDLGGHTYTGRMTIDAGTVTVKNGQIVGRFDAYDNATVNLAADAEVIGQTVAWGDGTAGEAGVKTPTLNVYGKITNTGDSAISTNGTDLSGAKINIYEGAVISSDDVGIYLPSGNLTVNGGTITGATAIYQKSGTLTITGGTITGTGAAAEYSFNGDGANAM